MAEVIKTVLTADSSELAAEFAKASAIAQKYAADREAQGNRSLAAARAEVEALRLEATGHGAAAAALREKMQLTEQARQLAAKAGLTEENATRILARQLDLKKQMVTAAAAAAAAENRAARISAPGRNGIALPEMALTAANLQAMEKGTARANALQSQLGRLGAAGARGQAGLMQLAYAADDAQYGMKGLSNNIPAIIQAFGGSGGMAAGIGIAAVALYAYWKFARLVFKADELDAYTESVVKGAAAWGEAWKNARAELAKTRAEQQRQRDMEGFVIQANQALFERVSIQDQILQGMEREKDLRAEAARREDALRSARDAVTTARGGAVDPATANAAERARMAADLKAAQEESARAQQESLRLNEARNAIQESARAGIESRDKAIDALKSDLAGSDANIADYEERLKIIKESDIASRREAQAALNASKERKAVIENQILDLEALKKAEQSVADANVSTAAGNIRQMDEQSQRAWRLSEALKLQIPVLEETQRLQKQAADITRDRAAKDWKIELDIQKALAGNDVERARMLERQRDIEAEKRRIMAEQKGISEAMAGKQAEAMVNTRADASAAAAQKTAREELEILRARAAGENNRAGQLRSAATLEREILNIMREQNVTRAEATAQAKERQQLERNQARGDIMAEIKALKMEAGGDKAGADRLREEMRIRADAVALAERLGITESQAANLLREKARLEKEIADRKKTGGDDENRRVRHRGIRRLSNGANDMNSGNNLQQWQWNMAPGLRNHELARRGTERTNRPTRPADDAAKNLLKSVNIQEAMLKIWQKLNVV